jgi:MoxR-like ATPase
MATTITINGQSLSAKQVALLLAKVNDKQKQAIIRSLNIKQKVQVIRYILRDICLEREEVIDRLIALYLSSQHGIIVGPPGNGKSYLVNLVNQCLGGKIFQLNCHEYTKLDDLVGQIDPKKLMDEGVMTRNSRDRLTDPETTDAFLDEGLKMPPSVINTLLTPLNERYWFNPGKERLKLRSVIFASNELVDDPTTQAFDDRVVMKTWLGYLEKKESVLKLWQREESGYKPSLPVKLSLDERDRAWDEIKASMDITASFGLLLTIKEKLEEDGYKVSPQALLSEEQQVSDRKWLWIHRYLKALAWVKDEEAVTTAVIQQAIVDCLWFKLDDIASMQEIVDKVIHDLTERPANLAKAAQITFDGWMSVLDISPDVFLGQAPGVLSSLDDALDQIDKAKKEGCLTSACDTAQLQVEALKTDAIATIASLKSDEAKAKSLVEKIQQDIDEWKVAQPPQGVNLDDWWAAWGEKAKSFKGAIRDGANQVRCLNLNGSAQKYLEDLNLLKVSLNQFLEDSLDIYARN